MDESIQYHLATYRAGLSECWVDIALELVMTPCWSQDASQQQHMPGTPRA